MGSNPKIISGEVPRYTGILNCFTRVSAEQGFSAFWRGNTVNVIRYFPTQAFNFAFKDTIKAIFPKYNSKTDFWKFFATNLASGGAAGAGSLTIVYPLDYARTRLASDVGSGNPQFTGLVDCLMKTASGGGIMSMYNGFGVSVVGIVAYRGPYFGVYDTLKDLNPFKRIRVLLAYFQNSSSRRQPPSLLVSFHTLSTQSAVVCRCSLRNLGSNGSTVVHWIAP